jgi:hypothetical protein
MELPSSTHRRRKALDAELLKSCGYDVAVGAASIQ